jgi:hypothetical protein
MTDVKQGMFVEKLGMQAFLSATDQEGFEVKQGMPTRLLTTDQEGAPAPSSRSALSGSAGLPRRDCSASLRRKIKQPALDGGLKLLMYDRKRVNCT